MKRRWPFGVSRRWGEIEPWSWLRHITPWFVLDFLCDRYHICRAGVVMWKMGHGWAWDVRPSCLTPHDYCGFYDYASAEERVEGWRIANEDIGPMFTFKDTP